MMPLQYITHRNRRFGYLEGAQLALRGGCRWIQLRMKEATDEEFVETGCRLRTMCRQYDATFVIDDRVHLVSEVQADGVHLGQRDMPVAEARALLNNKAIVIGGTANTFEDIVHLYEQGADYIGCGPFRFTTTKRNLAPVLGLKGYQDIIAKMKQNGINIPLIAIGGIQRDDVAAIMQTGVSGIAVSSAVLMAADPAKEMRLFLLNR